MMGWTPPRSSVSKCGTALWLWNPTWPERVRPHAGAIDTPLPQPPIERTPGFLVNGTPLREFGQAQLKALVAQELARPKPQ